MVLPQDHLFATPPFADRADAGRRLLVLLRRYATENPMVLALPRGGVIVGAEIALGLECALDLVVTRKIGHPLHPEYGIGAVSEDGYTIFNEAERELVDASWLAEEVEIQHQEALRRRLAYMNGKPPPDLHGKSAILVDDGIATGYTLRAALNSMRARQPMRVVVAVPIAPLGILEEMRTETDDFIALLTPTHFGSVGAAYRRFGQVTDEEVREALRSVGPAQE